MEINLYNIRSGLFVHFQHHYRSLFISWARQVRLWMEMISLMLAKYLMKLSVRIGLQMQRKLYQRYEFGKLCCSDSCAYVCISCDSSMLCVQNLKTKPNLLGIYKEYSQAWKQHQNTPLQHQLTCHRSVIQ